MTIALNSEHHIPENVIPHFKVEHGEDVFRVYVGNICFGEFVDTASNRKGILPFLREMRDGTTGNSHGGTDSGNCGQQ